MRLEKAIARPEENIPTESVTIKDYAATGETCRGMTGIVNEGERFVIVEDWRATVKYNTAGKPVSWEGILNFNRTNRQRIAPTKTYSIRLVHFANNGLPTSVFHGHVKLSRVKGEEDMFRFSGSKFGKYSLL